MNYSLQIDKGNINIWVVDNDTKEQSLLRIGKHLIEDYIQREYLTPLEQFKAMFESTYGLQNQFPPDYIIRSIPKTDNDVILWQLPTAEERFEFHLNELLSGFNAYYHKNLPLNQVRKHLIHCVNWF